MKKQTLTEKLAEAIAQHGMRIAGEGTMTATGNHFFLVTAREYATTNRMYVVEHIDGSHTCNCPATKPCVHIALVSKHQTQALKDERERAEHLASLPRTLANVETSEAEKLEQVARQEVERHVDLTSISAEHLNWKVSQRLAEMTQPAPLYGDERDTWPHLPSLPDGWEINEEGAGWVARHNGAAILTASYRNVKRFSSWQAARHAIDNQMHAEQVQAKSRQRAEEAAKREAAMPADHTPETFSIYR